MRPAVFFDRDGVVNELVPDPRSGNAESPLSAEDVALIPGAAGGLLRLRAAGYVLVGVSNQPAAAKGTVDPADLHRVQARVLELLELEGFVPDGFELCFHHPEGTVPALTKRCHCRKPAPGMLVTAATEFELDLRRSWLIGDTDDDVKAGIAAGAQTILVETPGSSHKRRGAARPSGRAANLGEAASLIIRNKR